MVDKDKERKIQYRPTVSYSLPAKKVGLSKVFRRISQVKEMFFSKSYGASFDYLADSISKFSSKAEVDYYEAVALSGLYNEELAALSKVYDKNKIKSVLIVGCGCGREAFHFKKMGIDRVDAVDLSETMIERARSINDKNNFDVNFMLGSQDTLPDHKYDIVYITFSLTSHLQGIENRVELLKKCASRISDGVILVGFYRGVSIFPNRFYWSSQVLRLRWLLSKRKWERGDVLISHLGYHNASERMLYLHFYQSDEEIQNEVSLANLKGELIPSLSSKVERGLDNFWILTKN